MAENGTIDAHYRLLKEVSSKGTLSLKFSEDGKYLASASVDKTAKVWDTDTWEVKATLVGHQKGINDLAWTSCGNYIATASDDFTLRIWEANSGKCLRLIEGHTNYVFCCNFNPQGNMLISGSYDETLKVWNVRDGRCMRSIPAHSDPITSVSFSHDGTMILSSSFDGLVRLWDTDTGRCLKTIIDEPNPPVGIARFTPNSRYILIGTMASRIDLWDYEAQKKLNKGILIIPDIFGWDAKNNRLLADKYAAKGFLTILPDFFADDAVPLEALQAKDMPTFLSWIERNGPSVVNPKTEKFIEYLKEQKVTSIGIVGYCWGGRFGALLTHIDQVKALVINHGSFMTEEHVKSIRIPSLWNCADNDSHIKKDTIEKYKEILKKNDAPGDFKYYDGANHGWTARGDDKDPELAPKISDAFDRGIEFFNKYL